MLLDESFDEPRDEVLLASRKDDGLFEDALESTDGARAAGLDGFVAEDVLDSDPEGFGEKRQHIGAWWDGGGFPVADGFRGNAYELGELGLAESGSLTQGDEACCLLGPGLSEMSRHAGIVRVHLGDLRIWEVKVLA